MNHKGLEIASKFKKCAPAGLFDSGVAARLPPEYRKFYDEWRNTPPEPVHYIPKESKWYQIEDTGVMCRTEDLPIPRIFPKELNDVFTGGESVVQGFVKRSQRGPRVARFWVPHAFNSVIYSEILDKYMRAKMTKRVVELIHKHRGLDNYILSTKACDLFTLIAIRLKRKLLITLQDKDLPYDEQKNELIYEKYKKFLIPPKEIEWYGLTYLEAIRKLEEIEEEEKKKKIIPLKHIYRAELIEELKSGNMEEAEEEKPSSWFSKIPGISKLKKDS